MLVDNAVNTGRVDEPRRGLLGDQRATYVVSDSKNNDISYEDDWGNCGPLRCFPELCTGETTFELILA